MRGTLNLCRLRANRVLSKYRAHRNVQAIHCRAHHKRCESIFYCDAACALVLGWSGALARLSKAGVMKAEDADSEYGEADKLEHVYSSSIGSSAQYCESVKMSA